MSAPRRWRRLIPGPATDPDGRRVQHTALQVAWRGAAAGAICGGLGLCALMMLIFVRSRHEAFERGQNLGPVSLREFVHGGLVVGVGDLELGVFILGVAAVLVTGVIGWYAGRKAVAPLGEALRLQRNFVADASHELRTPLTVLDARVQILQHRLKRGEPVDEVLERLRGDASVMRETLDDLLLAAEQSETGAVEPVDAVAAVRELNDALAGLAQQHGVELAVRAETAPALVGLPAASLRRCLTALIDNAIRHTPADGRVATSIERAGGWATIRVADTGTGIVGVPLDEVFERFAHSHGDGPRRSFGLGLALSRDVAARAGGELVVESTSPAGTVFRLRLPLVSPAAGRVRR